MLLFFRRLPKAFFYVKRLIYSNRKPGIIVACMPKSGSTFLTTILAHITKSRLIKPIEAERQDEQNLFYPILVDLYGSRYVAHIHLKASESNIRKIVDFGLKPIVLIRNLYDVVVSLNDHLHREDIRTFNIFIDHSFCKLPKVEQYDRIIDLALPWYINFYVSWSTTSIKPHWVTYEDLTSNSTNTIQDVLNYCDVPANSTEIENAISSVSKSKTRFNKGIGGRGKEELSDAQIARIQRLCQYYPNIDFSPIL